MDQLQPWEETEIQFSMLEKTHRRNIEVTRDPIQRVEGQSAQMIKVFICIRMRVPEIILEKIYSFFNNNSFCNRTYWKELNNHKALQLKRRNLKNLYMKITKLTFKISLQISFYMKEQISLWMILAINQQSVS